MARKQATEAAYVNALGVAARAVVAHSGGCDVGNICVRDEDMAGFFYCHRYPRHSAKDLARVRTITEKYCRVEAGISLAEPIATRLWSSAQNDKLNEGYWEDAEEAIREVHPRSWQKRLRETELSVEKLLLRREDRVKALTELLLQRGKLGARTINKILPPTRPKS